MASVFSAVALLPILAVQLLMENILTESLELEGLCSSSQPLLVTHPPSPTAARS